MNCTGVYIWARGGGGMIIFRRSFLDWSVAPARSALERALTASVFADVWSRSQCKSGVTL